MVSIQRSGLGKCIWCGCERKGAVVEFHDGSLKGWLCWKDLRRTVEARNAGQPATHAKADAAATSQTVRT